MNRHNQAAATIELSREFRPYQWFNSELCRTRYAIQTRYPGRQWIFVMHKGSPLIFDDERTRDAEMERKASGL